MDSLIDDKQTALSLSVSLSSSAEHPRIQAPYAFVSSRRSILSDTYFPNKIAPLASSAYIYTYISTYTYTYIDLPGSTWPLASSTYTYTYIYIHLPRSTWIYLDLPPSIPTPPWVAFYAVTDQA